MFGTDNLDINNMDFIGKGGETVYGMGVCEESGSDPMGLGRVKCRIFGIHPEDKDLVPTKDLPWAMVLRPPTAQTMPKVNQGDWVFMIAIDGKAWQYPLVMGIINTINRPSAPNNPGNSSVLPRKAPYHGQGQENPTKYPGTNLPNTPGVGATTGNSQANIPSGGGDWVKDHPELKSFGPFEKIHLPTYQALLAAEKMSSKQTITSAYRSPQRNQSVGGASRSMHLTGRAFDIKPGGEQFIKAAVKAGFTGFGMYSETSFHIDTGNARTWGADYRGKSTPDKLKKWLKEAGWSESSQPLKNANTNPGSQPNENPADPNATASQEDSLTNAQDANSQEALQNNDASQYAESNQITQDRTGASPQQWDAYRQGIADLESSGGNYGLVGGSGGKYYGAYQMGNAAISDAARVLGEQPPSIGTFLNNPAMQERYFDAYTSANYRTLSSRSSEFNSLSTVQQLQVLGFAHNAGAGAASNQLNSLGFNGMFSSGVADGFGTKSSKFMTSVGNRLNGVGGGGNGKANGMPGFQNPNVWGKNRMAQDTGKPSVDSAQRGMNVSASDNQQSGASSTDESGFSPNPNNALESIVGMATGGLGGFPRPGGEEPFGEPKSGFVPSTYDMVTVLGSKAHPSGIILNDTDGAETILIHQGKSGSKLEMGHDGTDVWRSKKNQYIMSGGDSYIGSTGDMNIGVKGAVKITGQETNIQSDGSLMIVSFNDGAIHVSGKFDIQAGETTQFKSNRVIFEAQNMDFYASQNMTFQAEKSINMSSKKMNFEASDKMQQKSKEFVAQTDGDMSFNSGKSMFQESKNDFHMKSSDGAMNQQSKGAMNFKADGAMNQQSKGDFSMKSDGNLISEAGTAVHAKTPVFKTDEMENDPSPAQSATEATAAQSAKKIKTTENKSSAATKDSSKAEQVVAVRAKNTNLGRPSEKTDLTQDKVDRRSTSLFDTATDTYSSEV